MYRGGNNGPELGTRAQAISYSQPSRRGKVFIIALAARGAGCGLTPSQGMLFHENNSNTLSYDVRKLHDEDDSYNKV